MNRYKNLLNYKILIATALILMIALTCVSLSSAADVNSTYEGDININENLVVINNESVIENSTEDNEISNNVEEIDWSAY